MYRLLVASKTSKLKFTDLILSPPPTLSVESVAPGSEIDLEMM